MAYHSKIPSKGLKYKQKLINRYEKNKLALANWLQYNIKKLDLSTILNDKFKPLKSFYLMSDASTCENFKHLN